ncbi:MAG: filamentous hemagglutinin N-terminal domain-containing protein, partial [Pseudomonadota bacterium]|nr:filamentous hemagglutinin N-terminal domain-containing protein [Pseudomonadota bacterium]
MTRTSARIPAQSLPRTPCNVAALIALGLLATPVLAATSDSSKLLNNVVLRGLVSDYRTSATFATTGAQGAQTLTINQLLPKIILDWNQFNLANGDTIQFVQPSAAAAVLNRIHDANPTTISGAIKANGQVFLVNQNGILFHNGSQIDTNSFFASTLNIDDTTFNSG